MVFGSSVLLEGAEVEGLAVLTEVGGLEVAGGSPSDEVAVGAGPGVLPAEAGLSRREGGVGLDPAELRRDLPHARSAHLDVHVAQTGGAGHVELDDRATNAATSAEPCQSRTFASAFSPRRTTRRG